MATIGIFFGTDTGKTRKIAKLIQQKLGEAAASISTVPIWRPFSLIRCCYSAHRRWATATAGAGSGV